MGIFTFFWGGQGVKVFQPMDLRSPVISVRTSNTIIQELAVLQGFRIARVGVVLEKLCVALQRRTATKPPRVHQCSSSLLMFGLLKEAIHGYDYEFLGDPCSNMFYLGAVQACPRKVPSHLESQTVESGNLVFFFGNELDCNHLL